MLNCEKAESCLFYHYDNESRTVIYMTHNSGKHNEPVWDQNIKRCCEQHLLDSGFWGHIRLVASTHDDVIKWNNFPRYWPFVRGIHWSLVNSPHKGQWRRALMFLWSSPWINGWENNPEAGDLRCHHAHCDTTVMYTGRCCYNMVHYNTVFNSLRPSDICVSDLTSIGSDNGLSPARRQAIMLEYC